MNRDELIKLIEVKYPKLDVKTSEEFDGRPDGIWCSGEDGVEAEDGFDLFDYYAEDYAEKRYVFGIHKEFGRILKEYGWYAEWQDAGTLMISKD